MDESFSSAAVISFLKQNLLIVSISTVGVLLLLYGFFTMGPLSQSEEAVVYEAGNERDSGVASTPQNDGGERDFVDISGAVAKPGVYEVAADSRVGDVLQEAGGLTEDADRQGIAKAVNLAAKVSDGMKLYFPFVGETAVMGAAVSGTGGSGISGAAGGAININSASQSQLEDLPGVGAVTAGKIIAGRPYGSVEELKSKKVVGSAVYEKIKDLVTVN